MPTRSTNQAALDTVQYLVKKYKIDLNGAIITPKRINLKTKDGKDIVAAAGAVARSKYAKLSAQTKKSRLTELEQLIYSLSAVGKDGLRKISMLESRKVTPYINKMKKRTISKSSASTSKSYKVVLTENHVRVTNKFGRTLVDVTGLKARKLFKESRGNATQLVRKFIIKENNSEKRALNPALYDECKEILENAFTYGEDFNDGSAPYDLDVEKLSEFRQMVSGEDADEIEFPDQEYLEEFARNTDTPEKFWKFLRDNQDTDAEILVKLAYDDIALNMAMGEEWEFRAEEFREYVKELQDELIR